MSSNNSSSNSSSKDIAVSVRGLSKSYTIAHNEESHSTLAETVLHGVKNLFQRAEKETFWALKDVEFDIRQGDVVGIIGRNGAGKSTLLKVLSQITEPTTGEINLYGRVGSLLEVGTGFHPELTGRENIYLNGAILGMRRKEIERQFDAIVEFAEVEQFLDTPVKRYSSGMYVRLAFAVAAHLNPEILIVDEVLAVGDAEFQRKCLGKMQEVAGQGRTVILVSHQMESVAKLCTQAILLHHGKLVYAGSTSQSIEVYLGQAKEMAELNHAERRSGSGEMRFSDVRASKEFFNPDEEKCFSFSIERKRSFATKYFVSAHVVDANENVLVQMDSRLLDFWIDAGDSFHGAMKFRHPWLKAGKYRVDMFICVEGKIIDQFEGATTLHVAPVLPYPFISDKGAIAYGAVFGDFDVEALAAPQHEQVEQQVEQLADRH